MKIKTDNTNTLLSEQRVIVRYFIMLNIFVKSLSSFTVANCLFFLSHQCQMFLSENTEESENKTDPNHLQL